MVNSFKLAYSQLKFLVLNSQDFHNFASLHLCHFLPLFATFCYFLPLIATFVTILGPKFPDPYLFHTPFTSTLTHPNTYANSSTNISSSIFSFTLALLYRLAPSHFALHLLAHKNPNFLLSLNTYTP